MGALGARANLQCQGDNITEARGERPAHQGAFFLLEEGLLLPGRTRCLESADRGTDSAVPPLPANRPAGSLGETRPLPHTGSGTVFPGCPGAPPACRPSPAHLLPRPELKSWGSQRAGLQEVQEHLTLWMKPSGEPGLADRPGRPRLGGEQGWETWEQATRHEVPHGLTGVGKDTGCRPLAVERQPAGP